jgi:carbon monoxide dehydrogenase subunit G
MIRIEETVHISKDAGEAFAFLADFRNLPDWDPGIAEARRTDASGAMSEGARFEVVADFLGRRVPMAYRMTRYDLESREAELVGETSTLRATDRIEVTPLENGAIVRWRADFELAGLLRFSEPLMRPVFERLGRKAMAGMRRALG